MSSWTMTPVALTNGETRVPDMNFKTKYGDLTISGEIISPEADPVPVLRSRLFLKLASNWFVEIVAVNQIHCKTPWRHG